MGTDIKQIEETCKKLKESIEYANKELSRLEGAKETYESNIASIKETCNGMGVKVEDLDSVIYEGEAKLIELVTQAEEYISKIKEIQIT